MRVLIRLLLVAFFALGTFMVGWWAVPIIAALWGIATGRFMGPPGGVAALSAALAWALLLALDAAGGRLGALGDLFGSIARLPAPAFFALTLAFPAVLAGSAAALTAAIWPDRARSRHYVPASHVLLDDSGHPTGRAPARG